MSSNLENTWTVLYGVMINILMLFPSMYLFWVHMHFVILPAGRWQLRCVSGVVVRQATMHWYAN